MKINKTTSFLLYAADLEADTLLNNGMTNAYLNDCGYERPQNSQTEDDVYLVFELDEFTEEFESFCTSLRKHKNFLDEYDTENSVVFRFKLSSK